MNTDYEIKICSDVDYENLIAEIYIDNHFFALISQDNGPENIIVEFRKDLSRVNKIINIKYEDMICIFDLAKIKLLNPAT